MNIDQANKQSVHIAESSKKAVTLDEKNLLSLRNDLTPAILNRLCKDFDVDMHFLLAQMFYLQEVTNKTGENDSENGGHEEFESFLETYFDLYADQFELLMCTRENKVYEKIVVDVDRIKRNLKLKFKIPVSKTAQSLKESLAKIINIVKSNGIQLNESDLGCLDRLEAMAMTDLDNDCSWFSKFIAGFPEAVNEDMSLQHVLSVARTRLHLLDEAFQKDFVKSWRDQLYNESQFFLSIQLFLRGIINSIDSYADQYGAIYEELCKKKTRSAPIAYHQKIYGDKYYKTGTVD